MTDNGRKGGQSTIADVARAAGVSQATAARALGGYGYVGAKTRQRVLDAAERLGYQPNQLARSMVTGRSKTIGVVVADIENLYFAKAIRAITDAASANGFGVVLANTDEDVNLERQAVRVLLSNRVDGLIVAPASSVDVSHLSSARDTGCPFVLLDRRVPFLNADTFAIDNFRAAHEAVSSLIAENHRRIALVSNTRLLGDQDHITSPVRERIDGYRAALKDAEIPVDPALIVLGGWDEDNLTQQLRELCESPDRPTAFLAITSSVALILLKVFWELELTIPDQVSIISFDDADWTAAVTPPLTVVSQPIKDLATAATENLIAGLRGERKGPGEEFLLQATLIERGSVSRVS
jgi:LacI family transcriptional regulator